jgi:hypothetical protein
MKNNTTIICLTLISIVGLLMHEPSVLVLWMLYGVYKLFTTD